jgi:uncharacterized protein YihD (DUF1040 family)
MLTDSYILRFADAAIDPVWRHQRQVNSVDPVAADELFADYLDELVDDEQTATIRLDMVRDARKDTNQPGARRYYFDDVLRQAIVAEVDYAPLG